MMILAIVDKEDTYGYRINHTISKTLGIQNVTSQGVLRELQEQNYLTAYDLPFQGRNRKYYKITTEGRLQYKELIEEWTSYKETIDKLLGKETFAENET